MPTEFWAQRSHVQPPRVAFIILLLAVLLSASSLALAEIQPSPEACDAAGVITLIRVVRTGWQTASVLGSSTSINCGIDVRVDGIVVRTGSTIWNGDYWFLYVPVVSGSHVRTCMGLSCSDVVPVPTYVPQPIGPPGFISAHESNLTIKGTVVQLFGVNEQTAFIYAMIASGLWGYPDPNSYWGRNALFPAGPDGRIPGVSNVDSLWREYFRYFLHYNQVAGDPDNPRTNVLRIWVADDTWFPDGTYLTYKTYPVAFWNIFDRMAYWADRAGVYLVPVLGHYASDEDHSFFDRQSTHYAHQVELVSAIMDRYNWNARIAMWDLWNEPDIGHDAYWASVGGIDGFKAWVGGYIADVKPHSSNHLVTMGIGGSTTFPGVPPWSWRYHFFYNDIPGLDVSNHHTYSTAEDQYLINFETDWHQALCKPHYESEFGYNLWDPGNNSLGYGYWPWYANHTRTAGWPAISTMVFLNNSKGPYADYPYLGPLPPYPFTFKPYGLEEPMG